ncbi:pickpocket protein 11-like [Schistocerca piceifrons]|uniref:pickpocket protein 11-like n=1 Tax=Schistocerca piceifrons TaxID=274613 RepID=UPI001F5EAA39|nr:pickpocket protein 11-like [Schistocerca piceifrons]
MAMQQQQVPVMQHHLGSWVYPSLPMIYLQQQLILICLAAAPGLPTLYQQPPIVFPHGAVPAATHSVSTNVYVHSPDEPAQMTSRVATVGPSESAHVYLQATAVRASPEVWGLRLSQRRCRFPWESPLPTTPVYSYAACRIYCRLLLARRLCGCAPHFYKRTDSHPVCGIEGMKCLFENRHMLQRLAENETGDSVCSCLPQCEGSKYVLASTQRYNWNLGAQLTWGLQKYPHMRMRRDVIFGFTDLLVSTGGSLGLFLGCSVLTLAEVLYLLVYRPFAAVVCKLLRKK